MYILICRLQPYGSSKMKEGIDVTVRNRFILEKRDLNVYHHFTRSAYMISYNSSITLPLHRCTEGDYLHITIVYGPGNLTKESVIDLPAWTDSQFFSQGNLILSHTRERVLLEIPPGPPVWQLKITRPPNTSSAPPSEQVTIGDRSSNFLRAG
jgi:hypothetical protein